MKKLFLQINAYLIILTLINCFFIGCGGSTAQRGQEASHEEISTDGFILTLLDEIENNPKYVQESWVNISFNFPENVDKTEIYLEGSSSNNKCITENTIKNTQTSCSLLIGTDVVGQTQVVGDAYISNNKYTASKLLRIFFIDI